MDNGQKLIKKPTYKGGKVAMSKFIKDNLKYPKKALEEKTEGVVTVRIDIDYEGKVRKAEVKKKLGNGCDEEAIRVASLLEFYVDSKKKVRMTFHKTINIHFRLPKKKAPAKPKAVAKRSAPANSGFGSAPSSTHSGPLTVTYTYIPTKKG